MQQQFKDDVKAAWQQAVPTLKKLAINVGGVIGAVVWGCVLLYLLLTAFWAGMFQLGVTVVGVVVLANYMSIVSARKEAAEYEARAAERAKRRGW